VVALIDPEFSKEKSQVDAVMVAADGRFELTGVEGRRYILVAHSENAVIGRRHLHSPIVDLLPGAQEPVELSLSDDVPEDDCEVCKRFSIHLSPLWDETKKPHKN